MERLLSTPVRVSESFDRRNETAFRSYVDGEFALTYRKDGNIVLPFGFSLGFTGANGEQVIFTLDGTGTFTVTSNGSPVLSFGPDEATFALDNDGRVVGIKLSGGSTTEINMLADAFNFYDGITDRPLISAAGGRLTVNGDLNVTGSFLLNGVRVPVSAQASTFYKADGEAVLWAGGEALNAVPDVAILLPSGVSLAAGEAWEQPTITGITTVGGTLRLKISTPSTTTTITDTTDAAGGGGSPDRVMAKSDSADAYNGVYSFRVVGQLRVVSYPDPDSGGYVNEGYAEISPWFNDGGGFDEGPHFFINPWDIGIPATTGSSVTGNYAYDVTVPVNWADPIGAGGTYDYGVSIENGTVNTTLTDLASVSYLKQITSGVRTGSPNGEQATIIVTPKNQ